MDLFSFYSMASITPIAYNTGSTIGGTTQYGSLAVGDTSQDYGAFPSGARFWATPDLDLYYVIARSIPSGNQPNPLSIQAFVGFEGCNKTENDFVTMANNVTGQNFTGGTQAKTWLETNGYWTSYPSTPGIVLPNLQLYLTAGNVTSYPGSGNNWYDLSPNAFTATLTNGVGYSASNGGTLTFNGSNQYVNTNNFLNAESFSVCAWFRKTSGGVEMIISKETNGGWPWNYRIWMNGGQIVGDIAQSGAQFVSVSSPLSSYNNGNWYNVVFTRNDSILRLYVNGVEVNNAADPLTGSITNNQTVWIGLSAYLGGSYDYIGDISEIMIYNAVLTASEVLQNFNATKTRFGY